MMDAVDGAFSVPERAIKHVDKGDDEGLDDRMERMENGE